MSDPSAVGAFAIIPCNDLDVSTRFWVGRLCFADVGGDADYRILTGWGCEVHLTRAGKGVWAVPEHNPFAVFIRTPRVDEIAALIDDLIIRPGGILRHREWGMYECGLSDPDGLLIRIGWPSALLAK